MNWKQEDGYITTTGPLRASVKRRLDKYVVRVGGLSAHWSCDTEEEAKQFGEEQLQLMKRALIWSLITKKGDNLYKIGGALDISIVRIHDDTWAICAGSEFNDLYKGTLEECKNYIVECF